jgi:hypothetical protein
MLSQVRSFLESSNALRSWNLRYEKGASTQEKETIWQEVKVKVEIVQRGTYYYWVIEDEGSLVEGYTTSLIDALDEIAIERGEATFSPVE